MDIATVHDIAKVERIIGHSTVFHSSHDDGTDDPKLAFEVAFWWLTTPGNVVFLDEGVVVMFQPRNFITYEMHIGVVDWARKDAFRFAVEACRRLFGDTHCRKIVAMIPEFHRAAILYAKLCGMRKEGVSEKSFQKDGELHDCVLLGATKEKLIERYGGEICQQQ